MSTAAWGFIGVILGALIAGGIDFLAQRRREQAAMKVARRLVAIEVQTLWMNFHLLLDAGTTPTFPFGLDAADQFLPTESWESHRDVLARGLDDTTWGRIALLTHAASRLRMMLARDTQGRALSAEESERYSDLAETAKLVYRSLMDGTEIDADPGDAADSTG